MDCGQVNSNDGRRLRYGVSLFLQFITINVTTTTMQDDQQSQSLSLLLGPATFIPQPTLPPFTTTPLSSPADSQSQTSMAKPLGRTQTLAQIATTPPFPDVFSTPVSTSASSSLFQHRDSSAALSDDDEEDDCDNSIKIDVDNNDWEDGTQPLEEDVTMGEPQPIQPQPPVCSLLFFNYAPSATDASIQRPRQVHPPHIPAPRSASLQT